ncbi:MAG: hypothetical protein JO189_15570 [Deltaproteobacteria bacterium]|nr:hypothetical protein [Deltaproteobacteria bacterium]
MDAIEKYQKQLLEQTLSMYPKTPNSEAMQLSVRICQTQSLIDGISLRTAA